MLEAWVSLDNRSNYIFRYKLINFATITPRCCKTINTITRKSDHVTDLVTSRPFLFSSSFSLFFWTATDLLRVNFMLFMLGALFFLALSFSFLLLCPFILSLFRVKFAHYFWECCLKLCFLNLYILHCKTCSAVSQRLKTYAQVSKVLARTVRGDAILAAGRWENGQKHLQRLNHTRQLPPLFNMQSDVFIRPFFWFVLRRGNMGTTIDDVKRSDTIQSFVNWVKKNVLSVCFFVVFFFLSFSSSRFIMY